jgi:colanic acid/amylovoran biosynthesis protein
MPFARIREHGFHLKFARRKWGIQWGALGVLIPRFLRVRWRLVLERELTAVLDASGFAYADQWPIFNLVDLADVARACRRYGTKLVLLPQAFGPFSDEIRQRLIREGIANASLVFPRDLKSLDYLRDACGESGYHQVAPDFTNLVTGEPPSDLVQFNNTVAIVPNQRMLDKSSPALAASYFEFMVGLGQRLSSLGYRIIVVVHETQLDARLAAELAKRIAGAVTLSDEDPRKLKGVLGACRCVISSRYHALVAALSQGVPAFGTSWSHKYPALFSDYEFRQGLLDTADLSNAIQVVTDALSEPQYSTHRSHLRAKADELSKQSGQMWSDVFQTISKTV